MNNIVQELESKISNLQIDKEIAIEIAKLRQITFFKCFTGKSGNSNQQSACKKN